MSSSPHKAMVFLLAAMVTGCAGVPAGDPAVSSGEASGQDERERIRIMPFAEPPQPVNELSAEIVFSVLAGEVAMQRGELDVAYDYQMEAALLAGDAKAAERATRIALHKKQGEMALAAAREWVRLAPNSLGARQLLASLLLSQGEQDQALSQLHAIVRISEARGEDGFMHAISALARDIRRPAVLDLVRRFVADYPTDPRSHYAFVLSAMLVQDLESAEAEAERLITRFPQWYKSYLVMSRIHLARSDEAAAMGVLAEAAARFPKERDVIIAYVKLLIASEEYETAYEHLQRLYKINADDEEANYWLAMLAMEFERPAEAEKYLEHLYALGKRRNTAAFYLGVSAERRERPEAALQWYRKVEKGEFHFQAEVSAVRILGELGRVTEARNQLQAVRIALPEHSVELYLAEVELLREHGDSAQVISLFAQALEVHPDDEELLYARALYAVTLDRLDILEQDLSRVLEVNPDNADALNALGYTLADKTDRLVEAHDYIQRALALKPDAPAILDSMGWVLYRMGRYQDSLEYLRKAFEQLQDSEIAAHFGEVLWVMGDKEQARKVWRDALEKDPDSSHLQEVTERLK